MSVRLGERVKLADHPRWTVVIASELYADRFGCEFYNVRRILRPDTANERMSGNTYAIARGRIDAADRITPID